MIWWPLNKLQTESKKAKGTERVVLRRGGREREREWNGFDQVDNILSK